MRATLDLLAHPVRTLRNLFPYDYHSPGLDSLPDGLAELFPSVETVRPFNPWVPHRGRQDRRFPGTGLLTLDEAALLYNYGLRYVGKPMLEIGCWVGWSTVAIGLSGIPLTVIDPVLGGEPQGEACRDAVSRAGLGGSVALTAGYSPEAVCSLAEQGKRWAVFFIDGNHEGDAPLRDVQACLEFAHRDAVVLFHDAIQPNVCDALAWLEGKGWQSGMHYTAQFIGVAWRGSARPIAHVPDPRIDWDRLVRRRWPHCGAFTRV